jgi:hypoxanthine phosphoribosyltransferase
MRVLDKEFVPFIELKHIEKRVSELAIQINRDYTGKKPILLGILNGSFMFMATLAKYISIDAEFSFVKFASYDGVQSSGEVRKLIGFDVSITGKDLIIVEDIIDTGFTMQQLKEELAQYNPASVRVATLLHKPDSTKIKHDIHYLGFIIPSKFVIGFGLDYNGFGRNINELMVLKE